MIFSRHNIFSRIAGSENYFIVNPLHGVADILDPQEALQLQTFINGNDIPESFHSSLVERNYIIDEKEEDRIYRTKYLDSLDSRDDDEVQLFFVPNYNCNFACSYCYQDEYTNPSMGLSQEVIDAFFTYVTTRFSGRKKYLTVFGGEPLIGSPKQKELIASFLEGANKADLEVCFVTNGYTLTEYIDILKVGKIREIQVTLDGVGNTHDTRRFLKGGGATFQKIVEGVNACLKAGLPVNLRVVIDKENIAGFPELARFAIEQGWTSHPLFKTQLGRNYELHHCQTASAKLFTRVSMYEHIFELTKEHPYILDFHKPAYSIARFLSENGDMPDPLFDACPACKTEWAFDYTGQIYSCTATVGKPGEELGTFYPEVVLNEAKVGEWQDRDVLAINECKTCNLQLACGGGCGSVAKNQNGSVCSPDCRPIKELLELGFSAYL
jgi:uncharacterized protein